MKSKQQFFVALRACLTHALVVKELFNLSQSAAVERALGSYDDFYEWMEGTRMKKENQATRELIEKFAELCNEYVGDDIDAKLLKKGVIEVINNLSE